MTSLKLANGLRLMSNRLGVRTISTSSVLGKYGRGGSSSFDDMVFGMASNLMRSLEREFDFARRQMDKNVRNILPSSMLPTSRLLQSVNNNDLVVTDKDGNRKFQLDLDLSEFEPEEIKVKTHGRTLNISAKKERKV